MELQMRCKTFMSSMVGIAAAAAGSANAAVTSSVSAFTTNYSFSGSGLTLPGQNYAVSGGMATSAYNWGFSTAGSSSYSVTSGGGSLVVSAAPAAAYVEVDFSKSLGFNLAGFEKFSIDAGSISGAGTTQLQISVQNDSGSGSWDSGYTTISGTGSFDFLVSSFTANSGNSAGATLDWSQVRQISLIVLSSNGAQSSSATFSNFTVTYNPVPAPGAAALIGVAGLVASRRRRS
jgi:MYXO-CTERM domain-containing protein